MVENLTIEAKALKAQDAWAYLGWLSNRLDDNQGSVPSGHKARKEYLKKSVSLLREMGLKDLPYAKALSHRMLQQSADQLFDILMRWCHDSRVDPTSGTVVHVRMAEVSR